MSNETEQKLEPDQSQQRKKQKCTEIDQEIWKDAWFKDFPWLSKSVCGKRALCTVCQLNSVSKRKGVFGRSGSKALNNSSFRRHERDSQEHQYALDNKRQAQTLRESLISVEETRRGVETCFDMIYWLAKEHIANRKYNSLRDLLRSAGCPFLEVLDARGNASYTSHQFVNEVLEAWSDVIELDILEQVHLSPAVGLLIDECTAVGSVNYMDLVWRLMDMATGRVKQRFGGI